MFWDALQFISIWSIPAMLVGIPAYGYLRGVRVYEAFVEGAKDGFWIGVQIIPYLVAILAAITAFRESGAMDLLVGLAEPVLRPLGMPGEVLPLALIRPLSGGGAFGVMADLVRQHGPDSLVGRMATVMQGSTDTTFYILTVYFGSVGIRASRHALPVGLIADAAGILASVLLVRALFA
ncbi:spore maturation protein [Thermaerobacter subterraneus]|uniref:Membrane protein n=1 Tax=Thermaerobacter subterraneus DSM 13965 TaxID=867903 RepID=K6PYQ9_9FIRM|nr:spore maturation protein [Thermaerobacter subterraneus]EKP93878.1 putative membrane protein [Thermaerobacter subterraneus DSM 13965]